LRYIGVTSFVSQPRFISTSTNSRKPLRLYGLHVAFEIETRTLQRRLPPTVALLMPLPTLSYRNHESIDAG
jgi:hypothetical protein